MTVIIRGNNNINNTGNTTTIKNSNNRIFHLEKDTEVYTKYMEVSNNNGSLTKDTEVEDKYIITSDGDYYIPYIHTIVKNNKILYIETTASRPTLYDATIGGTDYISIKYGINDLDLNKYTSTKGFEYKGKYYMILANTITNITYLVIIDTLNEIIDIKKLTRTSYCADVTGVVIINDIIYVFDDTQSFILNIENLTLTLHSTVINRSLANIYSIFTFNNEIYAVAYTNAYTGCYIYKINDSIDASTLIGSSTNKYVNTYTCAYIPYSRNIVECYGAAYSLRNSSNGANVYLSRDFITVTLVSEIYNSDRASIISLHGKLYIFNIFNTKDSTNNIIYTISDTGTVTEILDEQAKYYYRHYQNNVGSGLFTYNDSIRFFMFIYGTSTSVADTYSFSIYNFDVRGYFKKGWKVNGIEINKDGLHDFGNADTLSIETK